jgi:hypothetical protein
MEVPPSFVSTPFETPFPTTPHDHHAWIENLAEAMSFQEANVEESLRREQEEYSAWENEALYSASAGGEQALKPSGPSSASELETLSSASELEALCSASELEALSSASELESLSSASELEALSSASAGGEQALKPSGLTRWHPSWCHWIGHRTQPAHAGAGGHRTTVDSLEV